MVRPIVRFCDLEGLHRSRRVHHDDVTRQIAPQDHPRPSIKVKRPRPQLRIHSAPVSPAVWCCSQHQARIYHQSGKIWYILSIMQSLLNHQQLARAVQMAKTPQAQAGLSTLALLLLLSKLNSWLSRGKANNFVVDNTWNWSKEIVVVTGGSSGIGAEIVSRLERDNVKVINIDLNPPLKPAGR